MPKRLVVTKWVWQTLAVFSVWFGDFSCLFLENVIWRGVWAVGISGKRREVGGEMAGKLLTLQVWWLAGTLRLMEWEVSINLQKATGLQGSWAIALPPGREENRVQELWKTKSRWRHERPNYHYRGYINLASTSWSLSTLSWPVNAEKLWIWDPRKKRLLQGGKQSHNSTWEKKEGKAEKEAEKGRDKDNEFYLSFFWFCSPPHILGFSMHYIVTHKI